MLGWLLLDMLQYSLLLTIKEKVFFHSFLLSAFFLLIFVYKTKTMFQHVDGFENSLNFKILIEDLNDT